MSQERSDVAYEMSSVTSGDSDGKPATPRGDADRSASIPTSVIVEESAEEGNDAVAEQDADSSDGDAESEPSEPRLAAPKGPGRQLSVSSIV